MQAPQQEVIILNWEIFDLNKKLKTYLNDYSVIDSWTVGCLSQLITTVDEIMTNISIQSVITWDEKDKKIFQGYSFRHSINCKNCDRAIKTTKPSLLMHLNKCKVATNESCSKQEFIENASEVAVDVPGKSKQRYESNTLKQGTSSQSVASQQHQTKPVDKKEKLNKQNVRTKNLNANQPPRASRRKKSIQSTTSTLSNSTVSRILSDPEQSNEPTNSKKKNITDFYKQKLKEPQRKTHIPNRARDVKHVTKGIIPIFEVELTKKTKLFIKTMTADMILIEGNHRKNLCSSSAHDNILKTLEDLLSPSHPNTKAHLFGSRITGLGKETSDLDIYLDLEGNYDGSQKYSKGKLTSCVLLTEERLKESDQWSKLDPVTSARTPILRAWNTKENIDCDISFTHGLSHSNTKLIQYLFDLQPVCYYVALYVKLWSENFSMDGLNTYTLVLLTIFYFQKHELMPSIHSLQNNCKNPMFIGHWQANFERKSLQVLDIPLVPKTDLEHHILNFFSFYGSRFCFDTCMVCPLLGLAPQKKNFDSLDYEIPLEMTHLQKYYNSIDMKQAHPVHDLLSYMKPMVVQDPLELNHNVAKGLQPKDVHRFRKMCALTKALMNEVLKDRSFS